MARKKRTTSAAPESAEVSALPRLDVTDAEIVAAVMKCGGLPTRVADKFGMSLSDLMARAKASCAIAGAFAEMRQRTVDAARLAAFNIAVGNASTPPDPQMLRWYIERYE